MKLMTNNPAKYVGLKGYGLAIVGRVPLLSLITKENKRYLETKRTKMGHMYGLKFNGDVVEKTDDAETTWILSPKAREPVWSESNQTVKTYEWYFRKKKTGKKFDTKNQGKKILLIYTWGSWLDWFYILLVWSLFDYLHFFCYEFVNIVTFWVVEFDLWNCEMRKLCSVQFISNKIMSLLNVFEFSFTLKFFSYPFQKYVCCIRCISIGVFLL